MIDFFDFCNEMLCVADDRGYFVKLNSAWKKTLGWSMEELTSRPYIDFVHPDDVASTLQEATLLQGDEYETVHFQNRYRCKDGSYKWLAWQAKAKPGTNDLLATARDVTDERMQFEALQASEERFHSLADHAPIGIAQADASGNVYYVNQRMCEIVGVQDRQLLCLNWQAMIHTDDRFGLLDVWQAHLRSGTNMPPQEIRIVRGDDNLRWALCSVALVKGANEHIVGQIATIEDIHDRKSSELRLRALFDQAPVGIVSVDSRTGRFIEVNPKFAEILGRTQQEALALDFQAVTLPEDLQEDVDNMDLLIKGKIHQFRMEKRYVRPDGSWRWADLTVVPLWQKGEVPKRHLAVVEDISERKQAEERLQTKESQLAGLMDHSPNVVYLKDREGRYLLTNQRFQALVRKSESDIVGRTDLDLFPKQAAQVFQASDAEVWRDEAEHTFEEVVAHEDGRHTYWSVKFPVKDKCGSMVAIGGISTDITELTTAYEDLAVKERLLRNLIEVQEKEKQFICYEFHDGLVQYATGSLMILESLQGSQPTQKWTAIVERIIGNLRRGIEDGRRVIRGIRPTVLDDLGIKAAIDDLIDLIPTSEIAIEFDFDPGIGRLPKTLEATVYRVVQEAINNARRHSGSDRAKVTIRQVGGDLRIDVRDFGRGFDVKSVRQTGFGLLGMTERVQLLGGDCSIESVPGSGTCIAIRLPIETAEDVA